MADPRTDVRATEAGRIAAEAQALIEAGETEAAAAAYGRLVALSPHHPTLRHNLASLLADAGRFADAETEVRTALRGGVDAPETWLVLAHALQGQGRYLEAEEAYRAAIHRRPCFVQAHRELADLVWMRTGQLSAALISLDAALQRQPADLQLAVVKARVQEAGGDPAAAYNTLSQAVARAPTPWLEIAAAQVALTAAPDAALAHARRATAAGLTHPKALITLCEAHLAAGQAREAAAIATRLVDADPLDQRALCLQATAWRLAGDPRYRALFDYARLVRTFALAPPDGWSDLAAFLADLKGELLALHTLQAHPIGQSVRGGAQTQQSLLAATTPAIRGFFEGVDGPIRAYLQAVWEAGDGLRWRPPFDYRITGAWSVLLNAGGRHVSHMHPSGRVSSAFHVDVPAAVVRGEAGWLAFGEPDVPTRPALGAEHSVRPEPGRLVLFPSYMPHGTRPFAEGRRLAMAFDVAPRP